MDILPSKLPARLDTRLTSAESRLYPDKVRLVDC
jgi:hypothetical protein